MERLLTFSTETKLGCACDAEAPVLLRVTSSLLSPKDCEDTSGTYTKDFIQATLQYSDYQVVDSCKTLYSYTVKYDDSILVSYDSEEQEADPPLYSGDILGVVCDDTLAEFIREENGAPIKLEQDVGGNISLTNQYGCVYTIPVDFTLALSPVDTPSVNLTLAGDNLSADVIINPDADNLLREEADGLKVLALDVTDTASVDLTESVAAGQQTLSASVKISANAGNLITEESDGLFAQSPMALTVADSASVDLALVANQISADILLSSDVDNILTIEADGLKSDAINAVVDTSTIDLSKSANQLSANVKISANAGNSLTAESDGLFSAASFTANSTNSIQQSFASNQLTTNVKLSLDADNILTVEADGLKSDAVNAVTDSDSINLTKTNNDLTAEAIISPAGGNILQANGDGLFVPGAAAVAVADTNSVDMTLSGGTVSADVILSADADNGLSIEADGLKASTNIVPLDTHTIDLTVSGGDTLSADVRRDTSGANILEKNSLGLYVSLNTILEAVYPVGSIIESYSSTNPASYSTPMPGTWVAFGQGQVTIGVDPGDSSANSPGEVSGSTSVNLSHDHLMAIGWDANGVYLHSNSIQKPPYGDVIHTKDHHFLPYAGIDFNTFGNGQIREAKTQDGLGSVSVRQPSVAVYRWRRTA